MVNIGGRSKGCSTCRRRRVKCDESRPICRRCQRWNFECDGPRTTTFIHAESVTSSERLVERTGSATLGGRSASDLANPRPLLQRALGVVGFDVFICYTRDHLLRGGFIVSVIADIEPLDILRSESIVAHRRVSHQALLSFVTILFGEQHHQVDITRRGYAMYSVALERLNEALSDTTRHTSDEIIVAVATLAISECLVPSGKNNYLNHMMGLQRLIDLQEPGAFWSSKPYGFRIGVRFMILFASMLLKNPCILARPEWKSAMRVGASPKELQEQALYDILADCTVLLAKRENIVATWDLDVARAAQQVREVEDQGRALHAQLCTWRRSWDSETTSGTSGTSATFPGVASTRSAPASDSIPSMIMETKVLSRAMVVELILFDVALVTLLQILASLPREVLQGHSFLRGATAPQNGTESAKQYYASQERLAALEACRRVRSYVEGGQCLDASVPPILHWAIATALRSLHRDTSVEATWLRELVTPNGQQVVAVGLWKNYQWLSSLTEQL
ncbi:hypothetical protein AUP68_08436 [Ilyonectria robusta]